MAEEYCQYKHLKAKLRLLEALLSKQKDSTKTSWVISQWDFEWTEKGLGHFWITRSCRQWIWSYSHAMLIVSDALYMKRIDRICWQSYLNAFLSPQKYICRTVNLM